MAADQYCLKWNNHQSTLLVQFETLLESDSLTDCTLSAEGKYLNVHKVLLSACSPYFSKLLGEHKDKHPIFFMKDVAFEELKGIVEYMYKGEVNIMQERLDSFLKTASSLQIKGLADQDGGKGEDREEDPGGGRAKRKQAPDLRGGYGESSPMPEEPPRSPKRRRRPRPVSQDDSLPAQDQNHCDTTTAPSFSQLQQQQEVVMPTPLVPVKKTEPVDNSMVHLKTEIPDDVPQVDVQDLTLDDDEDFNNEDITQPGTSFSETSQDFAQWQQQMATQSGADESFMAATQGINQSGSQVIKTEVDYEEVGYLIETTHGEAVNNIDVKEEMHDELFYIRNWSQNEGSTVGLNSFNFKILENYRNIRDLETNNSGKWEVTDFGHRLDDNDPEHSDLNEESDKDELVSCNNMLVDNDDAVSNASCATGEVCKALHDLAEEFLVDEWKPSNIYASNSGIDSNGAESADVNKKNYKDEAQTSDSARLTIISTVSDGTLKHAANDVESSPESEEELNCQLCQFTSSKVDILSNHYTATHLGVKVYQCVQCTYTSNDNFTLYQHIKNKHSLYKDIIHGHGCEFNCPLCQEIKSYMPEMAKHIVSAHCELKLCQCPKCSFCCASGKILEKHIKAMHTKNRKAECYLCVGKRFFSKSQLTEHIKLHHKKFLLNDCPRCDYHSNSKYKLKTHIKFNHPEIKSFPCEHLTTKYRPRIKLLKTIKIPELFCNLKCPVCSFSCCLKGTLEKHVKSVHMVKETKLCSKCVHKDVLKIKRVSLRVLKQGKKITYK